MIIYHCIFSNFCQADSPPLLVLLTNKQSDKLVNKTNKVRGGDKQPHLLDKCQFLLPYQQQQQQHFHVTTKFMAPYFPRHRTLVLN